ncbi:hypothetical protein N9N08_00975 [bacterium]|nr:hypothetical protein [bacterium]
MKNMYNNEEFSDQVDVEAICKKHNIGRYNLIEFSALVARSLDLRPQDALKRILQENDLDAFKTQIEEKRVTAELSRQLRKS